MTSSIIANIGDDDWITYESELNRFVPRFPQVLLCLYDLNDFSGQLFVDIMRTHPTIL